jgi:hypothetical protein
MYLSGSECVACPANSWSLGGATYASACVPVPFLGPTVTVFSFSCDAAEGTSAFSQTGSPAFIADRFGYTAAAISFSYDTACFASDGGDALALTDRSALASALQAGTVAVFTLSFFVKSTETDNVSPVSFGVWSGNNQFRMHCGQFRYGIPPDGYIVGSGLDTLVLDGLWHHLAVTVSGGLIVIYVDGIQAASAGNWPTWYHNAFFTLGGGPPADCFWAGAIDDARMYARALSASEVFSIVNHPTATATRTASSSALPTATACTPSATRSSPASTSAAASAASLSPTFSVNYLSASASASATPSATSFAVSSVLYSGFADWKPVGTTSLSADGSTATLTRPGCGGGGECAGAVWSPFVVTGVSFSATFTVTLTQGPGNGYGAGGDGWSFVLHCDPRGQAAVGGGGHRRGVMGWGGGIPRFHLALAS